MSLKGGAGAGAAAWVRPEIRALAAYSVPETRGLVQLHAMENPYPWPAELRQAWLRELEEVAVNRYPDPGAAALKAALREAFALPSDAALLLGNGSDELIQLILLALGGSGEVVLAPEPTFVMYRHCAIVAGMRYVGVPLAGDDFSLRRDAVLAAVDRHKPAVVFLSYPNNPTGNLFDPRVIDAIIEASPGLVVLDEAYSPFAADSYLAKLGRHPSLVLMRTLSKLGFAGLRLGFLAGSVEWLGEFEKLRLPYNVNVLTQHTLAFALRHLEVFDEQTERIRAEREALRERLAAFPGVQTFPSEANFVLLRARSGLGPPVFEGLRRRGVLIKNLHGASPLLEDCLRVSVGTPEENRAFLDALADTLAELVPA